MSFHRSPSGLLVPDFNIQVPKIIPGGHNLRRLMKEDYGTLVGAKPPTQSYSDKVNDTYNPFVYWRLSETSGTTADNYEGTAARDGAYLNTPTLDQTGIGDGLGAPLFVPASNEHVNVDSASFRSAFDGAEGSLVGWFKVSGSGVWTDATLGKMVRFENGSNYVQLIKSDDNNKITLFRQGGGTNSVRHHTPFSPTGWFHLALTWSESAGASGEVKAYVDGSQSGATLTSIGTWGATPTENRIAAHSATTQIFDGYAAHVAVFTSVLSSGDVSDIATV